VENSFKFLWSLYLLLKYEIFIVVHRKHVNVKILVSMCLNAEFAGRKCIISCVYIFYGNTYSELSSFDLSKMKIFN
jgi:hypothetical protein